MIKGYWERRYDKNCESIYLLDRDKRICYTLEFKAHVVAEGEINKSTDININNDLGLLEALAQALQMGGYIPKSAVEAELGATKFHLEDMRKIVFKVLENEYLSRFENQDDQ